MPSGLHLHLTNDFEELARAIPELDAFLARCGASSTCEYFVHLAVEELVTNAIKYAWQDAAPRGIHLELAPEGAWVRLEVRYGGTPFDPVAYAAEAAQRPPVLRKGGYGLRMLRATLDRFQYGREGDENRVEAWVRLDAQEEEGTP